MHRLYGKITEHSLQSRFLEKEMEVIVYLPPTYSPLYTYPVLYAQDGKDYFLNGRMARQVEELIKDNKMKDIIVVGIPYESVSARRSMYHPEGELHERYLRFFAEELVPFVDSNFQTEHLATGRTLIGSSLGASFSLMATLSYPHSFGQLILQSPYVNDEILSAVENSDMTHQIEVYHIIGTQETAVQTTNGLTVDFVAPNQKLQKILQKKHPVYSYREFDGEHLWKHWQQDLSRALMFMFATKDIEE
ncbi:alpha/beta hydrolase [Bacillus alkalicellulosilyticus]|uniref:alpha/beta hydrolase n=1 Tax=Alkalihalobacterium alkalicellulosilyticum TaxID=1912214 RepID=UPI000996C14C|nr:alpha/beta hydrolase-fold protein [Bacillus alkalicellulosilyticus]